MKLFKKVDNKEVAYIQIFDLMYLIAIKEALPSSIFVKTASLSNIENGELYNFMEFTKQHEVKFIKELNTIHDFEDYKDFETDDYVKEIQKITSSLIETSKKICYLSNNDNNSKEMKKFTDQMKDCEFMLTTLRSAFDLSNNEKYVMFEIVPNVVM